MLRQLAGEGNEGKEETHRRSTELAAGRGDLEELRRLADEGVQETQDRLTQINHDIK